MKHVILPNALTEADTLALQKSRFWPIVLSIHHTHGLAACKFIQEDSIQTYVMFSTQSGFNVLAIRFNTSSNDYSVYTFDGPDATDHTKLAKSSKGNYITKRYAKYVSEKENTYLDTDRMTRVAAYSCANRMLDDNRSKVREFNFTSNMDNNLAKSLIEVALGKLERFDIKPDMHTRIEKYYKNYEAHLNQVSDISESIKDMFNGPKYIMAIPSSTGASLLFDRPGVLFGVINTSHLPYFISEVIKIGGQLPSTNDRPDNIPLIDPMKWYRSFDHLPEQYREEVLAKLTFSRLAREAEDSTVVKHRRDVDGYIPPIYQFRHYPSTNLITWRRGYTTGYFQWLMIDKA